jgi:hypothetical protein
MKLIPVTNKGNTVFAKIDEKDFDRVSKYNWTLGRDGYAFSWVEGKKTSMHRFILNFPSFWIDHKNGDPLDNRTENLRKSTNSQNQMNSRKRSGTSSIYKGVSWNKQMKLWKCGFKKDGVDYFIGYFHNERHAGLAYDLNASVLFGEFARLNFPSSLRG